MCNCREGENIGYFQVGFREFEGDRLLMLNEVCLIVGGGEWLDELHRVEEEVKVALLLWKGVEGVCNIVMVELVLCSVMIG